MASNLLYGCIYVFVFYYLKPLISINSLAKSNRLIRRFKERVKNLWIDERHVRHELIKLLEIPDIPTDLRQELIQAHW